jgi:hypothetical protein
LCLPFLRQMFGMQTQIYGVHSWHGSCMKRIQHIYI